MKRSANTTHSPYEQKVAPIAIIGMACRYPGGADNVESFWEMLQNGVDAISEIPDSRFNIDTFYAPGRIPGKVITREGGFLSDIDQFDPSFFGISPREAKYIDPQQRLLLKVAWEALEVAGQVPQKLVGSKTGVFIGIWNSEYQSQMYAASDDINFHIMMGGERYPAAGRVSFAFDFQGPSMIVDTACSSSLVATHLACQSIWLGEAEMALAGGVNIILEPENSIGGSQSGMLSEDGRCKFGDASANGYVRSEGVGMLVLKPLAKAIEDNDPIFAVVRGSAVNNDGRSGGVLSAPGIEAQLNVMRRAYEISGVSPTEIGYIEAHGTGTPTGDPIELQSLGMILKENGIGDESRLVGSIKTNIGHTEPASGIAGVMKAALCLKKKEIPASLHFNNPSPRVPWSDLPLKIADTHQAWPEEASPAFASCNSFGITGTNAHIILEEPPQTQDSNLADTLPASAKLFPFSSHTPDALKAVVSNNLAFLKENIEDSHLHHFAYTLATRRAHHTHRVAFVAETKDELATLMQSYLDGEIYQGIIVSEQLAEEPQRVTFVFSGMGPQWWGMGRELLENNTLVRNAIEECDEIFQQLAGWSILEEMLLPEESSRMHQTDVAQPANFVLQVALARLWSSWGIDPVAIVGHSTGEVAAAYAAGVLTLQDAVKVIYYRSHLQHKASGQGKMLAVGLSPEDVQKYLAGRETGVSIGAINSPDSVTLSGDEAMLQDIEAELNAEGIFARFLKTEVPYHSPKMDPLKEDLITGLQGIQVHPAKVPLYSTVSGALAEADDYDANYWWLNVREPVFFAKAINQMVEDGYTNFVEVGPHPVLSRSMGECLQKNNLEGVILPSIRRQQPEQERLLNSLGALYTSRMIINWSSLYPTGNCLVLPTYPWQDQSLWFEEMKVYLDRARPRKVERRQGGGSTANGQIMAIATQKGMFVWQSIISTQNTPYLKDHRVQSSIIFPGAAYINALLSVAGEIFSPQASLQEIELKEAMVLQDGKNRLAQIIVSATEVGSEFQFLSRDESAEDDTPWTLHVTGLIAESSSSMVDEKKMTVSAVKQWQEVSDRVENHDEHYQRMAQHTLNYGDAFQGVEQIWHLPKDDGLGLLHLTEDVQHTASTNRIHPAVLDASFQVLLSVAFENNSVASDAVYLPVSIGHIKSHYSPHEEALWCYASLTPETNEEILAGDIVLFNAEGQIVAEVQGLVCHKLKRHTQELLRNWLYTVEWQFTPFVDALQDKPQLQNMLVFANQTSASQDVVQKLIAQGYDVTLVSIGSAFKRENANEYSLNPSDSSQWANLVSDVLTDQAKYQGIVYLWSLTDELMDEDVETIESSHELMTQGLFQLLKSILVNQVKAPTIWCVTSGAQFETSDLRGTPIWGINKVVALEYPQLSFACVDFDPDDFAFSLDSFCKEFTQPKHDERQIAYRDQERFVTRIGRYDTNQSEQQTIDYTSGSYLVTGGLGGLGLEVAQWLAEKGARSLILLGRRGITNDHQAQVVGSLRESGVEVHIAKTDIAQFAEVKALIELVNSTMAPLRGVIHSAGVIDDGVLEQQEWSRFEKVMSPKVKGAWHLHLLTKELPLDFFILFSSLASMLGSRGQSNYAAANAFMDSLADYRHMNDLPALSLNWGPWSGAGMAVRGSKHDQMRWTKLGVGSIALEEGIRVLDQLVSFADAPPQVGIFPMDWQLYMNAFPASSVAMLEDFLVVDGESDDTSTSIGIIEELTSATVSEQPELLKSFLHSEVLSVLGLNPTFFISPRQTLFDLGIDSLVALELRNRLESSLDCALSATFLFDYPTLEQITDYIGEHVLNLDAFLDEADVEIKKSMEEVDAFLEKELEFLSEMEAEEMLMKELDQMDF